MSSTPPQSTFEVLALPHHRRRRKYPVGGGQPKANAGSPTYPVDVSATLTSDGRQWHFSGSSLDAMTGLSQHDTQVVESEVADKPKTLQIAPIKIDIEALEKR